MFKSKWQKKYEEAMKSIERQIEFHNEYLEHYSNCEINQANHENYIEHLYQKIAFSDALKDMRNIANR